MKYVAILDNKEREIEVSRESEYIYLVTIDGENHRIDARFCTSYWISLIINNQSYDISFSHEKDNFELNFRNHNYRIDILDERKLRMRGIQTSIDPSGPEILKSSMPGKVIKILAGEGNMVNAGEGIVIIEAMKMENEIECRQNGKIKKIYVKEGDTIEADTLLVEIDPE